MRFDLYLKRQRITVEQIVKLIGAESYEDLVHHFKTIGIKCPPEEEIDYEFKKVVEERPAIKSSVKKKRVSSKKGSKPKTDDSTSSRRSGSKQRARKSTAKPQRKSDSSKVEPVQPSSGSEDTK
jgi:hypothetical protein